MSLKFSWKSKKNVLKNTQSPLVTLDNPKSVSECNPPTIVTLSSSAQEESVCSQEQDKTSTTSSVQHSGVELENNIVSTKAVSNLSTLDSIEESSATKYTLGPTTSSAFTSEEIPSQPDTFHEFLKNFDSDLDDLLREDPILKDLHGQKLSAESVKALLAYEAGQGIRINLKREDGSVLPININKSETLSGLKRRICTESERELAVTTGAVPKISWKYIWRTNWLCSEGEKLKDDNASLKDLGLTNKSEIKFVKKLREKRKHLGKKKGAKRARLSEN